MRAGTLFQTNPGRFARVHRIPVGGWSEEAYDLLMVGGEVQPTGQTDDGEAPWAGLEDWARQRFPMIGGIEFGWSGQIMKSIDGLAFIGRNPRDKRNVYSECQL